MNRVFAWRDCRGGLLPPKISLAAPIRAIAFAKTGACNREDACVKLTSRRSWIRMKGSCKSACLVFAMLPGLCINYPCAQADTLYVSTFNLNRILEFDSIGNQSTFATASSGLSDPTGLAFDSSGNLYVANLGNNTIEKFSPSGTGSVFATAASGVDAPEGLAFDSGGNLYVANGGNDTIQEFSSSGTGSVFAASGINNPYGLTFDSNGNLYVANGGNNTIEKFNSSGQGSLFTSTNLLSAPIGLAFDSSGNLYVGNHGGSDILKIDPEGDTSVFASGLGNAVYLAIDEIPEPSSLLLTTLGAVSLVAFLRRKRA